MDAKANNQVRTLNEVTNNQTAFDRFCELTQRGYYIHVELKSKLKEKASLWITVSKENEEKEEIHLLVNQEILNIVIVYLETGKLDDTSKINPNDLESFNERGIEFKRELLQTEKGKGRKVIWAYNLMEKVASIHYNHGTIIFHPYSYPVRETNSRKNFVDEDDNKEKRSYPIVQSWLLEDKASYKNGENKEVIDTDFNSNYSLHSFSPSCTFAATKREEPPLVNNSIININTLNNMGTTNFAPVNENVIEAQTSSVEQSKSENVRKTKRRTTGLQPSKGDMYKFVSHTWNPIKGECLHECGYCRMSKLVRNHKPIRLEDKELKDDLGSSNFIFVGSNTDMFAGNVPSGWINQVLDYCDQFDNKYFFQSKNPERFIEFMEHPVFKKSVICTTIESNIDYKDCKAPTVEHRITAIEMIKSELDIDVYLSIEPIMDFDINEMVDLIKRCNPVQVYIGADSKSTGLTEPTKKKTEELIAELLHFTTVKENRNLKRLMKDAGTLEVEEAKNTSSTSLVMKIQVMQETGTGYEIKEENRRFGLIKENRPIKDSDVNGFLQTIRNGKYKKNQSIITVEATDVIETYNIVDLEGNPIDIENASEYLIVLDGQHRITAFSKLNATRKESDQITVPNVHIEKGLTNIREYLADINMVGHSWNTADKICVSAIATGSKLLSKVNELVKQGYTATTAVQICTGKRITSKQLEKLIITGNTQELPNEEKSLIKANKFLTITTSILGNEMKLLRKRYFINGFNNFAIARTEEEAFEALGKLSKADFTSVHEDNEFVEKLKSVLQQKAA